MSSNKLLPALRFPEFVNEGEWLKDNIDSLFNLQDGYPFSSYDLIKEKEDSKQVVRITDINNHNKNDEKVYVLNSKIQELNISNYEVNKGDLLLSLTGAAGFNFFIWNSNTGYINQRTMKISPKKKDNEALKILLEPLIHSKINAIGTGQNNNLSKDALKEIELFIPLPNEQQKIAACLSSLDELITAHGEKLALLKDHKKGLMQNLFPQKSESGFTRLKDDRMKDEDEQKILQSQNPQNPDSDNIPKLRFKEFENDGNWEEKKLGEVAVFINEKIRSENISVSNYISTENILSDYRGIISASKVPTSGSFTKYIEEDILLSNIRPYLKKVWFADKDGACSNDVFVVRAKSEISKIFCLSF
jgi:type I restriction enzyme S subunit